jgi:N-methylhydantoinase B
VACNERGVKRVQELIHRYGGPVIRKVFEETQDYSQLQVEEMLCIIKDGDYGAAHNLDGDGYIEDTGSGFLQIAVNIKKRGKSMICDFSDTSPQARGPINAPIAVTASSCYYVVLALAGGTIPPNSGAYRPLEIIAPEGSLVNASYPSPVVAGNTELSNRLVDLLLEALAPAIPDQVIGGSYGTAGVFAIGGWDETRKRHFVHLETTGGGMGASRHSNGLSGHRVHMGNTMNLPIEAVEAAMPIRVDSYALVDGTGGEGRWRGGMGARRVIRALVDGIEFSLMFERGLHPAHGAAGGEPGRVAKFFLEKSDGTRKPLSSKTIAGKLNVGDALWMETAGGGGWGKADPESASETDDV